MTACGHQGAEIMSARTISHELLSHFKQINLPAKTLQQSSLNELLGLGIIDQLVIRTFDVNRKYLKKYCKAQTATRNQWFDKVQKFDHKTKEFLNLKYTIKIETNFNKLRLLEQDQFPIQVTVNPSKFPSGKEMLSFLNKVLGKSDRDRIVWRIDFSVLLPVEFFTVEFFYFHLYVESKRKFVKFKPQIPQERSDFVSSESGDFTGIQYGSFPTKLQIYDIEKYKNANKYRAHNYESFLSRNHKGKIAPFGYGTVNVEYQMAAGSARKYCLFDYDDNLGKSLSRISPFSGFKLYNCFEKGLSEKPKILTFQLNCLKLGFQHTRSRFNNNNNVSRITDGEFKEILICNKYSLSDFLNFCFQEGVKGYFNL